MRVLGRPLGVVALLVLVVGGPLAAGLPGPIPPGTPSEPLSHASIHEAAFQGVNVVRDGDGLVPWQQGAAAQFTRDQMLTVLVLLERARVHPAIAADARAEAHRLWNLSQAAYNGADGFYDVSLAADALCLQLEANSWALIAAQRLSAATGIAAIAARADQLASHLRSGVAPGARPAVPFCPLDSEVPPSQWPLALIALFEYAQATGNTAARSAAMARLDAEIADRFDGAFEDPSGVYLLGVNARYLIALDMAAAQSSRPDAYRDAAAALAPRLRDDFFVADGPDLVGHSLSRDAATGTFRPNQPSPLEDAVWGAWALAGHANGTQNPTGAFPRRVLETLLVRHYSTMRGGIVGESGVLEAQVNALAALATAGSVPHDVVAERPRLAIAVPARAGFVYPPPGSPEAQNLLLSNEWTLRFALAPLAPAPERVVLPVHALAPVNWDHPASRYTPAAALAEGGASLPVQVVDGRYPLLQFIANLDGSTVPTYRLVTYAPIAPASSNVQRGIQVFLHLNASEALTVGRLQVDVDVADVQIHAVSFNDRALDSLAYTVADVGPTEYVPRPHVRLELRDLELRPGATNEVFVTFTDHVSPRLEQITYSQDLDGTTPLEDDNGRLRVGPRGDAWARAFVEENAALRRVALVVGEGLNATEVPMEPVAGQPGYWRAAIPPLPEDRATAVRVRAVDEHDNLAESAAVMVQPRSGLFQEGNLVMLVFSATLMVAAAAIYFKMGRRKRSR